MSSPVSKPQDEPLGPAPEESLSILLVEDNPGDARLFEEYLGESPTEASLRHEESLEEGLKALRKTRPDVLVVDLGLPDSEGAETVKAAAAAAPEVPIVVLTGQDDLHVALEAQEAGATEYLQKDNLTPALVGRTLRWALKQRRMQAKLRQRDAWIRSITEGLSVGVFRAGPTGQIEYANEALAEMLGFGQAEQLIGQDLTTFYANPIDRGRMLAEEGASEVEIEFEGQDGSTFVGLLSAKGAYDGEGKPVHYDGTVTDITERVRRKERLRTLSEAVEQAKEAVVITDAGPLDDPGPRVTYVNEAFEEMTGYSEKEIRGKTPRVLQGPETEREVLDSLREALETGEEWEGETVNYQKDGTPYRVQWNLAPVRGEGGDIEHWVSVQRDVTERRKQEERLRLLARGLQQVGDKVVITDTEGQIEYVNEAFEEMTGYSEEEVLEKTPKVLQSGEQTEEFYEELWDTIHSGKTFRAEFINERKNGTRYVEDEQISPVTDEEGRITHFVSAGRDISGQKEREEELRETKRLLEKTFESLNEVVLVVDPAGREILACNSAVKRIFGYEREELVGQSTEVLHMSREAYERFGNVGEPKLEEDGHFETEYQMRRKDGQVIDTENVVTPLKGDEWPDGVVSIIRDITDRKQREAELRQAKEEAEEAAELKSAMMANMSHEIRTPLTAITGFAEVLEEELEGRLKDFADRIHKGGERLMRTLDSVLQLSELEAGTEELPREPVRLNEVAGEIIRLLRPSAEEKAIDLTTELPSPSPKGQWNEAALGRILENLLENAIKFTSNGGTVWVRIREADSEAILEVEDTGIGISEEALPEVFEPFKQESEGLGREYEGAGLGLSVVKRLAEALGGTVEVETEKGEGSKFAVRLPGAGGGSTEK